VLDFAMLSPLIVVSLRATKQIAHDASLILKIAGCSPVARTLVGNGRTEMLSLVIESEHHLLDELFD
jgi:hypothetical protein